MVSLNALNELRNEQRVLDEDEWSERSKRKVKMVGVERFELPTSCTQSRRATRLRYTPKCILQKLTSRFAINKALTNPIRYLGWIWFITEVMLNPLVVAEYGRHYRGQLLNCKLLITRKFYNDAIVFLFACRLGISR